MQMHFGRPMVVILPQSPDHLGKRWKQAAVNGRQIFERLSLLACADENSLICQLTDDFSKQNRIEYATGFAEGTQGSSRTSQRLLHLLQLASLLDGAQGGQRWAEEIKQQQRRVLIEEKLPIPREISLRGVLVQRSQKPSEDFEILQSLNVAILDLCSPLPGHLAITDSLSQTVQSPARQRHKMREIEVASNPNLQKKFVRLKRPKAA
jgi:hypothetical protein